jgi:hypothetical protein
MHPSTSPATTVRKPSTSQPPPSGTRCARHGGKAILWMRGRHLSVLGHVLTSLAAAGATKEGPTGSCAMAHLAKCFTAVRCSQGNRGGDRIEVEDS